MYGVWSVETQFISLTYTLLHSLQIHTMLRPSSGPLIWSPWMLTSQMFACPAHSQLIGFPLEVSKSLPFLHFIHSSADYLNCMIYVIICNPFVLLE